MECVCFLLLYPDVVKKQKPLGDPHFHPQHGKEDRTDDGQTDRQKMDRLKSYFVSVGSDSRNPQDADVEGFYKNCIVLAGWGSAQLMKLV